MHEDVSIHCLTVTKAFPVLQNLFKTALTKLLVSQWQAAALLADSSFVNLVRASRNNSLLWSLSNRQKAMGEFKFTSREQDNSAPRVEGTSPVPGTFLQQEGPQLLHLCSHLWSCALAWNSSLTGTKIFFSTPLQDSRLWGWWQEHGYQWQQGARSASVYTAGVELQDDSQRCSKVGSALPAQQPAKSTDVSTP